jgi:limonene-1,2-epoxide hydrolase
MSHTTRSVEAIYAWAEALSTKDTSVFSSDARVVIDGKHAGPNPAVLAGLATFDSRAIVRRAFSDLENPAWAAAEWSLRIGTTAAMNLEIEQAVIIHLDADGRIDFARVHSDALRSRVCAVDAELKPDRWPDLPRAATTMTHADIRALQDRHVMQGWRLGSADTICSCHAPTSTILNAWETVTGYDMFRQSVGQYSQNFADTRIDVHHIVYDGQNIAVNQTWTTRNLKTGKVNGDEDLILGVMQDNLIYYWREYFDGRLSAQTAGQTLFAEVA